MLTSDSATAPLAEAAAAAAAAAAAREPRKQLGGGEGDGLRCGATAVVPVPSDAAATSTAAASPAAAVAGAVVEEADPIPLIMAAKRSGKPATGASGGAAGPRRAGKGGGTGDASGSAAATATSIAAAPAPAAAALSPEDAALEAAVAAAKAAAAAAAVAAPATPPSPPWPADIATMLGRYAAFRRYATDTLHIQVAPGVEVVDLPAPYGRGVLTTQPIEARTVLVYVPAESLLSLHCADGGILAMEKMLRRTSVPINEDDVLALMLLRERAAGAASKWAPFIAALPSSLTSSAFMTEAEVALFASSNIGSLLGRLREQITRDHAQISRALLLDGVGAKHGLPPDVLTRDAYAWALGMIWSRCVTLRIDRHEYKSYRCGAINRGGHRGTSARRARHVVHEQLH